jgi:hypothetical protein
VRSLLADDVRLDLVSQRKASGRRDVGIYFSNYERSTGWHLVPAWFDGIEVLAVCPMRQASHPRYFIELTWAVSAACVDPGLPLRLLHRARRRDFSSRARHEHRASVSAADCCAHRSAWVPS